MKEQKEEVNQENNYQKLKRLLKSGSQIEDIKNEIPNFEDDHDLKKLYSFHLDTSKILLKARSSLKEAVSKLHDDELSSIEDKLNKARKKAGKYGKVTVLKKQYNDLLEELIDKNKNLTPPIVWAMPKKINGNKNKFTDALVYSGSTKEKTVYIPFSKIHRKLIESNWIMRNGFYSQNALEGSPNYLLAHLVFIVSNEPYTIDPVQKRYIGGRRFIDFPFAFPLKMLENKKSFKDYSSYKDYIENYIKDYNDKSSKEVLLGQYTHSVKNQPRHSEGALFWKLNKNDTIKDIVSVLKAKLNFVYGSHKDFKVYQICLFLNSQKNICGNKASHLKALNANTCTKKLKELMSSVNDNSFLCKLLKHLNENNIKTPRKNNQFPRMFITVSAHEFYVHDSVKSDEEALVDENKYSEEFNIDCKKLSGKIILSTAEKWIDRINKVDRQENIIKNLKERKVKIPFYSGFRSSGGMLNLLLNREALEYDLPISFDGIENFTFKENSKKKSPER